MQNMMDTTTKSGSGTSKALLGCGMMAGFVFCATIAVQLLIRPGFDVVRAPLSLLSLGDAGWVQRTNFVVSGILALGGAVGIRRMLAGRSPATLGATLIALFGAGTFVAGLFPPDAAFGFPPGTPEGVPAQMSGHSMIHGIAFDVAFLSLVAACFIFARRSLQLSPLWRSYSLTTGIVTPILIVAGMALHAVMGAAFLLAGLSAFTWLSILSWQMLSDSPSVAKPAAG